MRHQLCFAGASFFYVELLQKIELYKFRFAIDHFCVV